MKIVVIGGTGLIGSKVVEKLTEHGHEAVPASPNTGVNTLTGEGLKEVLRDAQAVVDVTNSPSFEPDAVLKFFTTSTTNLLAAAADAGVGHYVALSVVGTDRLPDNSYFRAKVAQQNLIKESGLPYSIVHATQFFEFVKTIADTSVADGPAIRVTNAGIQPMAAADVSAAIAKVAVAEPANGPVEVGGPEVFGMDDLVRKGLAHFGDPREVITDPQAPYWGSVLKHDSLLPGPGARLAETRFEDWLATK
ncbi:SDR family oxidoreductase [Kibdelosporangium persicum]|uniref:NmrA family transcriptional regulator n=1 Tax=Kibdelosporangium persicum TaxID=2698649 RepID=A0ABX2F8K2_9PSEU|nr:SDR family oxidoreductase [Kibdelosporangium persicum]NRN67669.1 NmrA family transcriptional regulator [Kibdelosporangium persicum]